MTAHALPRSRDPLLLTPGPLTTSPAVKQAMLHDAGSWHFEFNALVAEIREGLLAAAGLSQADGWEAIPMQGSGTFGVEAVFQTCVPPSGKVVVLVNGAYGQRMADMLRFAGIPHAVLRSPEHQPHNPEALDQLLQAHSDVTHVAGVHCETTTGLLNPIDRLGEVVRRHGKLHVVDAMSSFGGLPIDFATIDYLVSSANKCLEGVPGFSFVLCRRAALLACEGFARSLSLDLLGQWRGFEKNGQFRYTPPTHALLAFRQALREFEVEGGVTARAERYRRNHTAVVRGLAQLGLRPYLALERQSPIITAFHYPAPDFDFPALYRKLAARGFIIYPGKLTAVDTFRIGHIGRVFPEDMEQLVDALRRVLEELGVTPWTEANRVPSGESGAPHLR